MENKKQRLNRQKRWVNEILAIIRCDRRVHQVLRWYIERRGIVINGRARELYLQYRSRP